MAKRKTTVATDKGQELTTVNQFLPSGLNSKTILPIKEKLENWKPETVSEAIMMKHMQYLFTQAKSNIDAECAAILDQCKDCEGERVDAISGLKVLKKKRGSKKVYNESDDIKDAETEVTYYTEMLTDARNALVKAQKEAGFTQKDNGFTYAVKL